MLIEALDGYLAFLCNVRYRVQITGIGNERPCVHYHGLRTGVFWGSERMPVEIES